MKRRSRQMLRGLLLGSALVVPALILADGRMLPGRAVDPPRENTGTEIRAVQRTESNPSFGQSNEIVYTRRDGSVVRRGEDRTSPAVAELDAGVRLEVLARETGRLRVRTADGREGYISPLHVTSDAPRPERQRRGIVLSDDLGPGERADVTAIRGLSPVSEEYAAEAAVPE